MCLWRERRNRERRRRGKFKFATQRRALRRVIAAFFTRDLPYEMSIFYRTKTDTSRADIELEVRDDGNNIRETSWNVHGSWQSSSAPAADTSFDSYRIDDEGVPVGLPVQRSLPRRMSSRSYDIAMAERHPPPARSMSSRSRLAQSQEEEEKKKERRKIPIFCLAAILANAGVFVVEIWVNGWQLQPFSCPSTCSNGMPCYEDGFTECEPNPMLGPRIAVLQRLGAKDDLAIFERGEWWRIAACNWLHAGVIHCLLNMGAIWAIGGDLERVFGFCRVAVLYILSGLFGTVVSIVFLPGTLSVGASASVFGLVGANWADIIVNFCARCTLKGSGVVCLTIATILNVAIGFTPFVDNFMHMGGMVAGLVIGLASFAQKAHRDPATGRRVHTCLQEAVVLVAVALLLLLGGGAVVAVLSSELQALLRSIPWARHVNCIPTPWWSCCVMASGKGTCLNLQPPPNASSLIYATCNMTESAAPYVDSCDPLEDPNCNYPSDMQPNDPRMGALCVLICSGCVE